MGRRGAPASLRLVPELRAAHIRRHREGTPAELVYLRENYDFAGSEMVAGIRKATFAQAIGRLWSTDAVVVELPEPLWMRFLPKMLLLAGTYRLSRVLRGRKGQIVTYAMENNDLATLVGGRSGAPRAVVRAFAWALGLCLRLTHSKICFASEASQRTYESLPGLTGVETTTVLELPDPGVPATSARSGSAIFVGVLEARKGVRELMDAWETVERQCLGATLTIVGPGPLEEEVRAWCARSPLTRTSTGRLDHAKTSALVAQQSVLVAPSVPDGRWKEQIGLPIKEALARGLTIVTTDQTGLADWLQTTGHQVIPATTGMSNALAEGLVSALREPLDRRGVQATLPKTDGRLQADTWLHRTTRTTRQPANLERNPHS